jgi:hypothetical protein
MKPVGCITRMRRDWEAERSALATVRRFNAILSAKGYARSVTAIPRALVSKPSLGSERRRRRRR